MIKEINSNEVNDYVHKEGVTVIKFTAPWCGGCKAIQPYYQKLADDNPNVQCLEMDADKNTEFVLSMGIKSLPTFVFYQENRLLSLDKGLNGPELKKRLSTILSGS